MAGVAISPTRPLTVAAAASRDSGVTTPTTGTRPSSSSRSAGSAAAVAELQATTSSFAPRSSRMPGELAREAEQLVRAAVAVREASGVAEVEKVLVRKRHEALVQHGQPADPGVEDGDGKRTVRGRHGRLWWHARRAAPAAPAVHEPSKARMGRPYAARRLALALRELFEVREQLRHAGLLARGARGGADPVP